MTTKKERTLSYMIKKGWNKDHAEKLINEKFDHVSEIWWKATPSKLACIISTID